MNAPDLRTTLAEIHDFCDLILRRVQRYGITVDSLEEDVDHMDLILMPLCQIGESVQRSREALEERFPEQPWHKMAGMRNVIVHGYLTVDAKAIFKTATQDIPALQEFCNQNRW